MNIKRAVFAVVLLVWVFPADNAMCAEGDYYLYDRIGDLRLIGAAKDLYTDRMDGTGKRRVTSTPETPERDAFFSKDGRYIIYMTDESRRFAGGIIDIRYNYFLQPIDGDDAAKSKIDEFTYRDLKKERIREKRGP